MAQAPDIHVMITAEHAICNYCGEQFLMFEATDAARDEARLVPGTLCCFQCWVTRLDREITSQDFTRSPINTPYITMVNEAHADLVRMPNFGDKLPT